MANKVAANRLGSLQAECTYANVVSKICGGQIVGASAPTDVNLRSRRTYHITVAIERVQKTELVGAGIWLNSPQCVLVYEE